MATNMLDPNATAPFTLSDSNLDEKQWLRTEMSAHGEGSKTDLVDKLIHELNAPQLKALEPPKMTKKSVVIGSTVYRVLCRDRNGVEDVLAFNSERDLMVKVIRNLRKTFPGMEYKLQWKIEEELPY